MKPDDRKPFLILMAMLAEAFNEPVSAERGKIYFEFLQKYPLYEVNWAIKTVIREKKFFPRVADLIEIINPGWSPEYPEESLIESKKNKEALEFIGRIAQMIGNGPRKKQLPQIDLKRRASGEIDE